MSTLQFAYDLAPEDSIIFDTFMLHFMTNRASLWPQSDDKIFYAFSQLVARSLISRGVRDPGAACPLLVRYVIPSGSLTAPNCLLLHWPPDYDQRRPGFSSTVGKTHPAPSIQYIQQVFPEVSDPEKFLVVDLFTRKLPFGPSYGLMENRPYVNEPDTGLRLVFLRWLLQESKPHFGTPAAILTFGSAARTALASLYPGAPALSSAGTRITINDRQRLLLHATHPENQMFHAAERGDIDSLLRDRDALRELSDHCGVRVNIRFLDNDILTARYLEQFRLSKYSLKQRCETEVQETLAISPAKMQTDGQGP